MELWSGNLSAAAAAFEAGAALAPTPQARMSGQTASGSWRSWRPSAARLNRAAELAAEVAAPPGNDPDQQTGPLIAAAEVALACVHTERNELALAQERLARAEDALRDRPNKLLSALTCLVAGRGNLVGGHPGAAAEMISRARAGWTPPAWLDHRLLLLESQTCRSDIGH